MQRSKEERSERERCCDLYHLNAQPGVSRQPPQYFPQYIPLYALYSFGPMPIPCCDNPFLVAIPFR